MKKLNIALRIAAVLAWLLVIVYVIWDCDLHEADTMLRIAVAATAIAWITA